MKKLAAPLTLLVLVLAASGACLTAQEENTPAPDFSVKDLKGNPVSLSSYKGKVLVLNFWATWCPPCREEIPDFIDVYKSLNSQGLEILGLSVDRVPPGKLLEWITKAGINYPIAMATDEIVEAYRPGKFIPSTIVVDRHGRIRYRNSGLMDKETLIEIFKEYSKS